MAKELRNLASPSTLNPQAVEKATDYDLVFETIQPTKPGASLNDRNLSRVRYCLGDLVCRQGVTVEADADVDDRRAA